MSNKRPPALSASPQTYMDLRVEQKAAATRINDAI